MVVNCCMVGCTTYESKAKYPLLSFHKVPSNSVKSKAKKEWRARLLRVVNRCDSSFNSERAYICSRHFNPDFFKTGRTGRKDLIVGSIPTNFIAKRSHERQEATERRKLVRNSEVVLPVLYKYRDFKELEKDLSKVNAPWVKLSHTENNLVFGFTNTLGDVVIKVTVNESLGFVVESSFKEIPEDHPIYKEFKRTISKKKINVILERISQLKPCQGIEDSAEKVYGLKLVSSGKTSKVVLVNGKKGTELVHNLHSSKCSVLCETSPCRPCTLATKDLARKQKVEDKQRFKPLDTKAPLTKVAKNRLVLAIRTLRDTEKKLEEKIKALEAEIESKGINLDTEVHKDFR